MSKSPTSSQDSHTSATYSNNCSAFSKRIKKQLRLASQSQSQSQRRNDMASTSSQIDQEEDASRTQPQQRRNGNVVIESSEEEMSEDDEMDDEATRMAKRQNRDARQKKLLRQNYRNLQAQADNIRGDLANTTVEDLSAQIDQANKLFDKVQAPSEAVLDSRVLIATSEAGALKARQLKIDADAFDIDEFLVRLTLFMGASPGATRGGGNQRGGQRRGRRVAQDDSDEDDEEDRSREGEPWMWGKVGKVLAGESKRPAILEHMYGPLQLEVKEKKARTQRQKQKIDESQRMRPEELQAEDVAKNENETGKVTARIAKLLSQIGGSEGIPYLQFIVNPDSFSQTVENMFYFSFLVREQKVAIEVEEDESSENFGDTIAYAIVPEQAQDILKDGQIQKHQVVLELSQQVWKDAIEAYNITEPMIPTREAHIGGQTQTQNGKTPKWGHH